LKHSEIKNKPGIYFHRKHDKIHIVNTITVSSKALSASYQASYRRTQNTITETVIFPAAADMVQTKLGKKCAQQLRNIWLSNNTISRRIRRLRRTAD
jgi:hypothetical protein